MRNSPGLTAILFLICALSCQIESGSFLNQGSGENLLNRLIPERLRGFVAARLWEQADLYMHVGPSQIEANSFVAGSYAGNTDLLPLLHAITLLVPHELAPWQLLATNLGLHLQRQEEAVRLLQQAIHHNRNHPEIHELYATIASIRMFNQETSIEQKRSALKYLQKAIDTFIFSRRSFDDHSPGLNIRSYFILRSRLEVELGYPRAALKSWEKSGLPLTPDQGRLASMLLLYRDRGVLPDAGEFKKKTLRQDDPVSARIKPAQPLKNAAPAKPPLFRNLGSLKAAFFLLLCVLPCSYFLRRKSA